MGIKNIQGHDKKIEKPLMAFCSVSLKDQSNKNLKKFDKEILAFEEILECFHITGIFDYLLTIVVKDMEAYYKFTFQKLGSLDHIENIKTLFPMNDVKLTTAIPI